MKSERRSTSQSSLSAPADFARPWLLAALAMLCVARPLLASEGASYLGDGQPFVLLSLIIGVICCLAALARGGLARSLNLVDGCVLIFVAVMFASGLAGSGIFGKADVGTPRNAVNMIFEWVGLGLIYLLTRQLVQTRQESRALVAVMVALATTMAAFGFYQVMVSLPADRAAYAANPDQVLMESVGQVFAPDSPERLRFEYRLRSDEPLATFALTNSLAGFLAPWLVFALGLALMMAERWLASRRRSSPDTMRSVWTIARYFGLALSILAVAGCLAMTKSRSGYLAVFVGLLLLPVAIAPRSRRFKRNWALTVVGLLTIAISGVVMIQGLHGPLLSAAWQSLGYRFEYWQSTLSMISRFPILGVGSGNFQDFYTQFKLPQASEEVRDPHNFLLEVWATGGTLAFLALAAMLGLLAWRTGSTPLAAQPNGDEPSTAVASKSVKFLVGGALLGFLFAFLVGPLVGLSFFEEQLVAGIAIEALVVACAWRWIVAGTLPAHLPVLALAVLAINLLAAGGISYPGVAGSFWMLAALAMNQLEGEPVARPVQPGFWQKAPPLIGMAVCSALAVACYLSAYQPVLACRELLVKADRARSPQSRIEALEQAAAADPLATEPWIMIGEMELARLKDKPTDADVHNHFVSATTNIFARRPHSSAAWRQVGHWYNQLYAASKDRQAAAASLECFRRAVELYPKHPTLRGEFAMSLEAVGESSSARRNAAEALKLDEQTPHVDLKLPEKLREQLEQVVASGKKSTPEQAPTNETPSSSPPAGKQAPAGRSR